MSQVNDYIKELDDCPLGNGGWSDFEDICVRILTYLFVPPLNNPQIQPRTYSGIQRRDAIFPNRNITSSDDLSIKNWHLLFTELNARMVVFEFKNYDITDIAQDEVNQTRNYLAPAMGRLGIMVCSKMPNESGHRQRNVVFNQDRKVILFLTKKELKEMLWMKERSEEPSDLIVVSLERFCTQHE